MNPCSRKAREYGLKLFFLKTEVEKSGIIYARRLPQGGFISLAEVSPLGGRA